MFKKILALVLAMALVFCLCGCNNTDDSSSSEEVEIIYQYEDATVSGTDGKTESNPQSSVQSDSGTSDNAQSSQNTDSSQGESNMVTNQQSQDQTIEENNELSLTDSSVLSQLKFNGRPYITSSGVSLDYPASSIEFKANCSGTVYLQYNKSGSGNRYFIIYVDGVMVQKRAAINDDGYLFLARGLATGEHTFKLINDTDVGQGPLVTFTKLGVDGALSATSSTAPVIEFLGDSLSSGTGALCANGAANQNSTDTASATAAYPYLIAQSLGYDYRIVSRGGIGLKAGTTTPDFLDFYKAKNYWRGDTAAFTSQNVSDVDVLVVNLGTNDVGTYKTFDPNNVDHVAKYSQYYADLITNIGYSTNTKIIFVAGVGGCTTQNKAFDGAIKILNAAGYNSVYSFTANRYMSGGAMHPTAQEQQTVANEILNAMKQNGMV